MSDQAYLELYCRLIKLLNAVRDTPELSHRYGEFEAIAAKELTIRAYNLQVTK
jgi:hypothetical protein